MKWRSHLTKILWAAVLLGLNLPCELACGAEHRSVSPQEAKALALEALPEDARHLPKLSLEGGDLGRTYPGFYVFSIIWAATPNGSAMYGSYAVDASTGDVFDAVSECTEISSPSLRKLQSKIRSQIHLSEAEYRKLRSKGPLCQK